MRGLSIICAPHLADQPNHPSALAQLVEQMTVNHWVAGSSPAGGAISRIQKYFEPLAD